MLFVNKVLKTNIVFVNVPLKLLSSEAFSAQNALNIVWQPGSARTRWESLYSAPPDSVAGLLDLRGTTSKGRERGGEGRGEWGEGRKELGGKGEYA